MLSPWPCKRSPNPEMLVEGSALAVWTVWEVWEVSYLAKGWVKQLREGGGEGRDRGLKKEGGFRREKREKGEERRGR